MSGFIPTVEGWEPELEGRAGLPVFITHGSPRPRHLRRVRPRRPRRASRRAASTSTYHEHGGGHHIDPRTVPLMAAWVRARIESF